MQVDIYRPKSRTDLYIFVPAGRDPSWFVNRLAPLGPLEFVKSRTLTAGQRLIGASADEIIQNLNQNGVHIVGVSVATQVSEGGAAIGGGILGASVAGPAGAIIGAILGFAIAERAKKVPDEL